MGYFCERCGCNEAKYFVRLNDTLQCRRCIAYQGQEGESLYYEGSVQEHLSFELTPAQKQCSRAILEASSHKDVLVHAICGAGKTELVLETITDRLSKKLRVGVAVARRQVVLQLAERYQSLYPDLKVVPVCEGHTSDLRGHLVVSTTHQLFRYHKTFDLLILDEPDAFPFTTDPVLQGFARQAVKGCTIYLTATPDKSLTQAVKRGDMAIVRLFRRPHGHDLPCPLIKWLPFFAQKVHLKHWLRYNQKPVLIFVPSKVIGQNLSRYLDVPFVHAQDSHLDKGIMDFKTGIVRSLITTTVLERGVTFENVQVVIMDANHPVFNLAALVQIAGRAGRSQRYPEGEVIFYCSSLTRELIQCLAMIKQANRTA